MLFAWYKIIAYILLLLLKSWINVINSHKYSNPKNLLCHWNHNGEKAGKYLNDFVVPTCNKIAMAMLRISVRVWVCLYWVQFCIQIEFQKKGIPTCISEFILLFADSRGIPIIKRIHRGGL